MEGAGNRCRQERRKVLAMTRAPTAYGSPCWTWLAECPVRCSCQTLVGGAATDRIDMRLIDRAFMPESNDEPTT